MRYASREELIRDWTRPLVSLENDPSAPDFDPHAALEAARAARLEEEAAPWARKRHVGFLDFAVRPGMGAAEALFWMRVASDLSSDFGPKGYVWRFYPEEALARYPEEKPSRDEIEKRALLAIKNGGEAVAAWLLPLIGLRQLAEWYLSGRLGELALKGGNGNFFFLERLGARLPSLVRRPEWEATLAALDEHLDIGDWQADVPWSVAKEVFLTRPAWKLAVALGHAGALRLLVESWPDDVCRSSDWISANGTTFVCAVRDAAFSRRHLARLGLRPRHATEAAIWLLHTGDTMLTPVCELARKASNQEEANRIVEALGEVDSDIAAGCLLELADGKSPAQVAARDWLAGHGDRMLGACVRIWAGGGKQAGLAERYLRDAWKGAAREAVRALLLGLDGSGVGEALLAGWEREQAAEIRLADLPPEMVTTERLKPLPGWVRPEALAELTNGSRRAAPEVVARLLALVRGGHGRHALVKWAREHASEESRDAFWQSLVSGWELAGTGSKDEWCLGVAVALCGASTAAHLARLITRWPTESQHQKAAAGLARLREMGDVSALQALVGIAQRTRLTGLRSRAEICVGEIAEELGLTTDELADTSVPACGLDAASCREFGVGARRFVVTVEAGGVPVLRSAEGKVVKTLPKPGRDDDPGLAERAAKEWKAFKKSLAETVKTQSGRLELALAGGRRWSRLDFERCIAAHPVLRTLAATLVWGGFDSEGLVMASFSVRQEDGKLIDLAGEVLGPEAAGDTVGLLHPLQVDAADVARWRERLLRQGGGQTVEQLERETAEVGDARKDDVVIAEFADREVVGATLRRRMDGMAWRRGIPEDAGFFYGYMRPFPAAGVTAIVETSGQTIVTGDDFDNVKVLRVFFAPGDLEPMAYWKHEYGLSLGLVDGVAYSETVRALRVALRVR